MYRITRNDDKIMAEFKDFDTAMCWLVTLANECHRPTWVREKDSIMTLDLDFGKFQFRLQQI
jgi:hypothetical protein